MLVTWGTFAESAPHLAGTGQRLMESKGVAFLATLRKSGAPRLHPIVPIFGLGGLHLFIGPESPKRFDLLRDGRYALHPPLGQDDEEFMLTGEAVRVIDSARSDYIADIASYTPTPDAIHFELLIETCLWTIWENVGQPETRPIREIWHADAPPNPRLLREGP